MSFFKRIQITDKTNEDNCVNVDDNGSININNPFATEINLTEVKTKLSDKTQFVKITDGTNDAIINESGQTLVTSPPPETPSGKVGVIQTEYDSVSVIDDNIYVIPNGETLKIQRFTGGAEIDSVAGSVVELYCDPLGTGIDMTIISLIFTSGTTQQVDLNEVIIGDGIKAIRMRRRRLGGGGKEMFGSWEGYY